MIDIPEVRYALIALIVPLLLIVWWSVCSQFDLRFSPFRIFRRSRDTTNLLAAGKSRRRDDVR